VELFFPKVVLLVGQKRWMEVEVDLFLPLVVEVDLFLLLVEEVVHQFLH